MLINIFLAIVAYKTKTLTIIGTVVAFFLGIIVYYLCIDAYIILFLYFVIITAIEKLVLKSKRERRTSLQVLSNFVFAFISLILYIAVREQRYFALYCSMLSVSICDTLASTMGTKFAKNVYSITRFKKIEKGVSGGISLFGSISGILASTVMALIYFILCGSNTIHSKIVSGTMVLIFGVLGMIIDSILGDLVQKKYYCPKCKKTTDNEMCCGSLNVPTGAHLLTNTQVNIVSEGIVFFLGLLII